VSFFARDGNPLSVNVVHARCHL